MELGPSPICPAPSQVHQEHGVPPVAEAGQLRQVLGVCSRQLQGVHDVQIVLVGGQNRWSEPCHQTLVAAWAPQTSQPTSQDLSGSQQVGSGLYLGQLDSQCHLEALHPHFHGQHVVVAGGAPGAMGNASCRDTGV